MSPKVIVLSAKDAEHLMALEVAHLYADATSKAAEAAIDMALGVREAKRAWDDAASALEGATPERANELIEKINRAARDYHQRVRHFDALREALDAQLDAMWYRLATPFKNDEGILSALREGAAALRSRVDEAYNGASSVDPNAN